MQRRLYPGSRRALDIASGSAPERSSVAEIGAGSSPFSHREPGTPYRTPRSRERTAARARRISNFFDWHSARGRWVKDLSQRSPPISKRSSARGRCDRILSHSVPTRSRRRRARGRCDTNLPHGIPTRSRRRCAQGRCVDDLAQKRSACFGGRRARGGCDKNLSQRCAACSQRCAARSWGVVRKVDVTMTFRRGALPVPRGAQLARGDALREVDVTRASRRAALSVGGGASSRSTRISAIRSARTLRPGAGSTAPVRRKEDARRWRGAPERVSQERL